MSDDKDKAIQVTPDDLIPKAMEPSPLGKPTNKPDPKDSARILDTLLGLDKK